jgi:hypothetical protein
MEIILLFILLIIISVLIAINIHFNIHFNINKKGGTGDKDTIIPATATVIAYAEIQLVDFSNKFSPIGYSIVYFHLVKITDENIKDWQKFRTEVEKIVPEHQFDKTDGTMISKLTMDKSSNKDIRIYAGSDHFKIEKNEWHDLYVAYASKEKNESIYSPNWEDVECMVTVLAKKDIPIYTNMGIFRLTHTYSYENFIVHNDLLSKHPLLKKYFEKNNNQNYPSHRSIALNLLTFIAIFIQKFYSDNKIGLLTSPSNAMLEIIKKKLNEKKLSYAIELNSIYISGYRPEKILLRLYNFLTNDFILQDLKILQSEDLEKLNLDKNTIVKKLDENDLKKICPWYCNIFENNIADTNICYKYPFYQSTFIYVPISSFTELGKNIFIELKNNKNKIDASKIDASKIDVMNASEIDKSIYNYLVYSSKKRKKKNKKRKIKRKIKKKIKRKIKKN